MSDERGAIAFAEKILELLAEARYTATYKCAVLPPLMDLCLERTDQQKQVLDLLGVPLRAFRA